MISVLLLPVKIQILKIIAEISERRYGLHFYPGCDAAFVEAEQYIGVGIHTAVNPFHDKRVPFIRHELARQFGRTLTVEPRPAILRRNNHLAEPGIAIGAQINR